MIRKNVHIGLLQVATIVLFVLLHVKDTNADNTDKLVRDLKSRDFQTRMLAVEELGKAMDKKAFDAFRRYVFVKKEHWKIKIKAIDYLGTVEDIEVLDFIIKIVNDPFFNQGCPAMQWHAIIALGKKFNKGTKAVDILIKALQYENLIIKDAVIESLGDIGDSKAVPYLIQGLENKSFAIRLSTIGALEKIGDIQAIPHLKRFIKKEQDPYIRNKASSLLKNLLSLIIFSSCDDFKK